MLIYKIENSINDKIYVGQSINDNKNYYGSGKLIKQAISKYGKINFRKEILDNCDSNHQLDIKEKFWIKILNSLAPNGYNISSGGNRNYFYSDRTASIQKYKVTCKRRSLKEKNKISEKISKGMKRFFEENGTDVLSINAIKLWKDKKYRKQQTRSHSKTYDEIYGKEKANEIRKNHSEFMKKNNPLAEKTVKEFWIEKYGNEMANKMWKEKYKKYKCKYCDKRCSKSMINRWHDENCKVVR